jgi:glycerol-3-phosphate dehydrogenase
VRGVRGLDLVANEERRYVAARVVNAAGPWSREVAARADRDRPELFVRSRAWNAVFDLPALGEGALAVTPPYPDARTYFVRSLDGRLYAGTGHAGCAADEPDPRPSEVELEAFVEDLRLALPGLGITRDDVVRVDAGFLPVERAGTADLTGRPAYVDHGRTGGPVGLHSIAGVKYTTARHVAAEVVRPLLSRRTAPASA